MKYESLFIALSFLGNRRMQDFLNKKVLEAGACEPRGKGPGKRGQPF
jgi:hypothetical protein